MFAPPLPEALISSEKPSRRQTRAAVITFIAALGFGLVLRGGGVFAIGFLFLIFVPLEKLFPLFKQKVFRRGLLTDLTHLFVNTFFATIAAIALAIAFSLPLIWLRPMHMAAKMPTGIAIAVALASVFVTNYWAHRMTHQIPFLWRFHAVHHSIQQMDWVASARLHPLDQAFIQACTIAPLFVLGYQPGVFAGAAAITTLLALFQHANVRLTFPVLRWLIPTPQWHHWHHAIDDVAVNKNFGLPVVDLLFGTAYLPKGKTPVGFGSHDPVPQAGYLKHMRYPFSDVAKQRARGHSPSPVGAAPLQTATLGGGSTSGNE
jgi:sterol desaturase/sphingolipid hydroxylase (fatty acid hydroxylase superfamily)